MSSYQNHVKIAIQATAFDSPTCLFLVWSKVGLAAPKRKTLGDASNRTQFSLI